MSDIDDMYRYAARRAHGPLRPAAAGRSYPRELDERSEIPSQQREYLYESVGAGYYDEQGYFCEPVLGEFMATPGDAHAKVVQMGGVRARQHAWTQ